MHCLVLSDDFPNRIEPWRGPYHRRQFECLSRLCKVSVVDPITWTRMASNPRLWGLVGKPDGFLQGVAVDHPVFWYLPVLGRGRHWRGVLGAARRSLAATKAPACDVVLATFAYPHGLAAKHLADRLGVPYVVKVRGTDLHSLPADGQRQALTSKALRDAAAVVAVSRNLAEIAVRLGAPPERVKVVPNGVDADLFPVAPREEARRKLGLALDGKFVLFVGHLLPVKGIDVLVEAFGQLQRRDSRPENMTLLVAGDGPLRKWVSGRVARDGLQSSVRLLGHVSRGDVALLMNAADAVILPSRNEGCPNVVLEALCSGTPVVASRVGAVPDLLNEECGIIVPPGEAEQLATAMGAALRRTWDRTTVRRCVEGMSWEANARKLYEILESARSAGPRVQREGRGE